MSKSLKSLKISSVFPLYSWKVLLNVALSNSAMQKFQWYNLEKKLSRCSLSLD